MEIRLFTFDNDKGLVDKSSYLVAVTTLTGTLRDTTNIIDPQFVIEQETLPTFNYAYVPEFNRYYYLVNITSYRQKLWTISFHVDVLMSFKTGIKTLTGRVVRNQYDYNLKYRDDENRCKVGYNLTFTEIQGGTDDFNIDDDNYYNTILYTLGGSNGDISNQ